MSDELRAQLAQIKGYKMSPAEKRAQIVSFAYGNAHFENPNVTREGVEQAVNELCASGEIDLSK